MMHSRRVGFCFHSRCKNKTNNGAHANPYTYRGGCVEKLEQIVDWNLLFMGCVINSVLVYFGGVLHLG